MLLYSALREVQFSLQPSMPIFAWPFDQQTNQRCVTLLEGHQQSQCYEIGAFFKLASCALNRLAGHSCRILNEVRECSPNRLQLRTHHLVRRRLQSNGSYLTLFCSNFRLLQSMPYSFAIFYASLLANQFGQVVARSLQFQGTVTVGLAK